MTGLNKFRFTGRLCGKRLAPGKYLLVATPKADGKTGRPTKSQLQDHPLAAAALGHLDEARAASVEITIFGL